MRMKHPDERGKGLLRQAMRWILRPVLGVLVGGVVLSQGAWGSGQKPTFSGASGLYAGALVVFLGAQLVLIAAFLIGRRGKRLVEESLQASERRYRTLIEHAPDAIVLYDADDGLIVDCNAAAEKLLGTDRASILGQSPERFYAAQQFGEHVAKDVIAQNVERALNGEDILLERTIQNMQGTQLVCEIRLVGVPEAGRRLVRASLIDVTQRKRTQEAMRIAATAFESQLGMVITNANREILQVNRAFTDITGYQAQEVTGRLPQMLSSGRHDTGFYAAMWESITRSGAWQGEIWNRRKNGEVFPEWLTITAVKNDFDEVTHYVATFSDITERKSAESAITNLAFYDPLTKLPNRRLLLDRLQQVLAGGARRRNNTALLFVDMDNFKTLNDTLGHANGDHLLEQVASRLRASVREGDTVARLGGDEFVVMLEDLSEDSIEAATQAEVTGMKILHALNQDYPLAGQPYHSTASIGVTLLANHHENIDEPLKRADLAMYQAKAGGRNTLRFFDPQMQAVVSARAALEADLRVAIEQEQFFLMYQAQVLDARVVGVEALVRWQHPLRGVVSPASFIPLAEETGLIVPLGLWVLRQACAQLSKWARVPAFSQLTIAVNVSPRQFHQDEFVEQVLAAVNTDAIMPQRLKLELTENLLVQDIEGVIAKMQALKAVGVGFSLDDFGTGYSSLAYLKRLPLDQLKIDQGFVHDVLVDTNDAAIAKMVIVLAKSLGLSVIAEGVETCAQRDFLANEGCHMYQGYLFSQPLPIDAFEHYLLLQDPR